jgi:hypothetical protein
MILGVVEKMGVLIFLQCRFLLFEAKTSLLRCVSQYTNIFPNTHKKHKVLNSNIPHNINIGVK